MDFITLNCALKIVKEIHFMRILPHFFFLSQVISWKSEFLAFCENWGDWTIVVPHSPRVLGGWIRAVVTDFGI